MLTLMLVLASGCTEPPKPLALEVAPLELASEPARPGWSVLAERKPEIPPPHGDAPRIELIDDPSPYDVEFFCPFAITWQGFPAISVDGSTILYSNSYTPGAADHIIHDVRWFGRVARLDTIYDQSDDYSEDGKGGLDCEATRRLVQDRIDAFQLEIGRQQWRQLELLDTHRWTDESVPLSERPVELLYHAGWFIARVPGQKVVERQAKPEWHRPDYFCDDDPHLGALWFDRISRHALISYDYASPACLCDGNEVQSNLVISRALIDEVDARSGF